MLSAGSGITPVMAMLRSVLQTESTTEVVFVHTARSREDVIFASELDAIASSRPNVKVRLHFTSESGRLDAGQLLQIAHEAGDVPAFVCGPESFMDSVRSAWREAGREDQLRFEWFGLPARASDDGDAQQVDAAHSQRTFVAAAGQPLLAAAEAAGLRPAFGCRIGVCHTCKCRKISGVTVDLRDGRISDEPGEMIQLCISAARSPVTLEL
jgi:ferredoxin-NADP reductase